MARQTKKDPSRDSGTKRSPACGGKKRKKTRSIHATNPRIQEDLHGGTGKKKRSSGKKVFPRRNYLKGPRGEKRGLRGEDEAQRGWNSGTQEKGRSVISGGGVKTREVKLMGIRGGSVLPIEVGARRGIEFIRKSRCLVRGGDRSQT